MKCYLMILIGFINTSFHPDNDESSVMNGTQRSKTLSTQPFHPIRSKHNQAVITILCHH